jgi:hypothetical protein
MTIAGRERIGGHLDVRPMKETTKGPYKNI